MILKKGKTNWIFLIIFIIFSVIFGGEIIYNTQYANKEFSLLEKPLNLKLERAKKEQSPPPKKTWQHYQNESFGIALDYPSDWEISLGSCSTPFWGVSTGCLKIEYKENKKCALYIAKVDNTQYQDLLSNGKTMGQKKVEIGGKEGVKITDCCDTIMPYLVKTEKGNFVINIVRHLSDSHSFSHCPDVFSKIIDTLKLL